MVKLPPGTHTSDAPSVGLIPGVPVAVEVTVKLVALVAMPPGVVTLMAPVVAPLGTEVVR